VTRTGSGQALLAGSRRSAPGRQPKYLRIYTELRDRVSSGRWPAGHPLPAQRELAAEFGVSVMTLRQALQLLADDGLIGTRHGSGTFVAQRYASDVGHLRSFATDLAGQGAEISTRLLAAGIVTAPQDVDARLGGPGDVLRLRRLRLAGGQPLIVQTSYLPAELTRADGPGADSPSTLDAGELAQRGLYTVLAEHGLAVTRAAETITPVLLGPADAADLGRPAGTPALLSHRVSFTAAGLPIVDDHALLPGDSVAITANRSPGQLEVQYTLATGP